MLVIRSVLSIINWVNRWGSRQCTQPLEVTKLTLQTADVGGHTLSVLHAAFASYRIFFRNLFTTTPRSRQKGSAFLPGWGGIGSLLLNTWGCQVGKIIELYQKANEAAFSTSQGCHRHSIRAGSKTSGSWAKAKGLLCQMRREICLLGQCWVGYRGRQQLGF